MKQYTKEPCATVDLYRPGFYIMDPDGVVICVVTDEDDADALLSHLNR